MIRKISFSLQPEQYVFMCYIKMIIEIITLNIKPDDY